MWEKVACKLTWRWRVWSKSKLLHSLFNRLTLTPDTKGLDTIFINVLVSKNAAHNKTKCRVNPELCIKPDNGTATATATTTVVAIGRATATVAPTDTTTVEATATIAAHINALCRSLLPACSTFVRFPSLVSLSCLCPSRWDCSHTSVQICLGATEPAVLSNTSYRHVCPCQGHRTGSPPLSQSHFPLRMARLCRPDLISSPSLWKTFPGIFSHKNASASSAGWFYLVSCHFASVGTFAGTLLCFSCWIHALLLLTPLVACGSYPVLLSWDVFWKREHEHGALPAVFAATLCVFYRPIHHMSQQYHLHSLHLEHEHWLYVKKCLYSLFTLVNLENKSDQQKGGGRSVHRVGLFVD